MRSSHRRWLILWALGTTAAVAWADDDPCTGFAWDVSGEQALFATWPQAAFAGEDAVSAPLLAADHLYELALLPHVTLTLFVTGFAWVVRAAMIVVLYAVDFHDVSSWPVSLLYSSRLS